MSDRVETRLAELGLSLPKPYGPAANYLPYKIDHGLLYISGQGARTPEGPHYKGKVGKDFSFEEAYEHAKIVGLGLLSVAKVAAGSLDRIEVLKVLGMVNAVPEFTDHPKVINGCSDLFVNVLGEHGKHARSAVGMGSLPNGMTVEIEAVMRVHD